MESLISLASGVRSGTREGAPKPDLKDLVVLPISDWFSLGDQLNISREELLVIKSNFHHDPQTCKRQMFQCWLISTSQASYHQLVVALKNAGDDSLAEELHIKYETALSATDTIQPEYPSSSVTMPNQQASTLSHPMLKDLVLLPIINWFDLGLQLNISEDNLDIIKQNNPNDTKACRREMFSAWLEINPDASYRQLVDALHTMGFHNIAERLCTKYGIPVQPISPQGMSRFSHLSSLKTDSMPLLKCRKYTSSELEVNHSTLIPPQHLKISVSNCHDNQRIIAVSEEELHRYDFEKLPAVKKFCPTVFVLDNDSHPVSFLVDVYEPRMGRKKSTCYLEIAKSQGYTWRKMITIIKRGHITLEFCFFKPKIHTINFNVHSIIDSEGNETIGWNVTTYDCNICVVSQEYCPPQHGVPHIQLAKPLSECDYDVFTKQFTQHRLSGNRNKMKDLSEHLLLNKPERDYEILGLIFNASYRWLVKDPDSLESPVLKLKEAVRLCKKEDCRNGSLLEAKAHIFLAQNFQSARCYDEAMGYIDAAKVSICYVDLCMERSAIATQEALWHAAQCGEHMPLEKKRKIEKLLSIAIDNGKRLKTYEGWCFFVYNLINMARLHLDIFYPFSSGRHQYVTARDPNSDAEKAKSFLDQVPEDFLSDTYPCIYKAFYYYTVAEYHSHTESDKDVVIHNLELAKKQLQEADLSPPMMKAINVRLALLKGNSHFS